MKRGMPSGAQTPDGIIFLLALIFSKAPPRYPPHHGAHWAYTFAEACATETLGIHGYLPSHPHARSQESKIFGRVFLPLNASGRIFRL